jgi:hypothetical protein
LQRPNCSEKQNKLPIFRELPSCQLLVNPQGRRSVPLRKRKEVWAGRGEVMRGMDLDWMRVYLTLSPVPAAFGDSWFPM